jgi:hypothetical protein
VVGTSHWALRYPLVLPLAAARAVLGDSLLSLVLPSLLAGLALVVLMSIWAARSMPLPAATLVAALVATNPLLIRFCSTAAIDPIEMLFVFGMFALLHRAATGGASWSALLLAGVLAGLGLLARETTLFALAAMGALFLVGYGIERRWYFVMGLGALLVLACEMGFYWDATGNPLYRQSISAHHDSTISRWVEQGSGVPALHPLVDPVVMLLFNHDFGLLTWIGVPLAAWLILRARPAEPSRHTVVLLGALALVWTAVAAGLWNLLPLISRYYAVPAIALSVLVGIALHGLWQRGRSRLALACGTALLIGNLVSLAVDNRNFMYGEHVLLDLARSQDGGGTIRTDGQTYRRAKLMLQLAGVADRVASGAPVSGGLFYYNPTRAPSDLHPDPAWRVLTHRSPPDTWVAGVLRQLPAGIRPPVKLIDKLGPGHPGTTLYAVP